MDSLIQAIDQASSSEQLLGAVEALAATQSPLAVNKLVEVLSFNNPGAAVAAVEGLVAVGDEAVEALLAEIHNKNYGARAWVIRALAGIGNPKALETLLEAVNTDFALSVRRAAARGLGRIQWGQHDPQKVGVDQERVATTLIRAFQDSEWVVRYAAIVGLEGLAVALSPEPPELLRQVRLELLRQIDQESDLAVRARAVMGLSRVTQQMSV